MRSPRSLRFKKLHLVFLALLPILLFQNCNPIQFSNFSTPLANLKSESNGGGYWGKPDYYRFRHGFTCEQKESAVSVLHIGDTLATLTENQKLACGAVTTNMDPKLIDQSQYQNEIVGYHEGIFEGRNEVPNSIPANLVEVWCRDGQDAKAIETITHYNQVTGEALSRIYYSGPSESGPPGIVAKRTPDVSTPRVLKANLVTVKNNQGFLLNVYRDQPAPQLGLFKGHLNAVIEKQNIERSVTCRLGGSLDPRIWPVAEIVDSNPLIFKWAPDFSRFAYTTCNTLGVCRLISSDPLGQNQLLLSSAGGQNLSADDFAFQPDSKMINFWGTETIGNLKLFQVPVDSTSTAPLKLDSQFTGSRNWFIGNQILYSSQGDRFISQFSPASSSGGFLRSLSVTGGPSIELNPPPSLTNPLEYLSSYHYQISKSTDRVAFYYGNYWPDLYLTGFDNSNPIKVVLPATSLNFYFLSANSEIQIPDPGNFAFVDAYTKVVGQELPHFQNYAVAMDGSQVIPLPQDQSWRGSSASGFQVLISDKFGQLSLFDLQSLKLTSLPDSKISFFSKYRSQLYSTRSQPDGSLNPITISLQDASESSLCAAAIGQKLQISEIDSQRILISSFDAGAGQINIFVKTGDQPCQLKNSIPLAATAIEFKVPFVGGTEAYPSGISPDGQKVLLHVTGSDSSVAFDNLYYVPLNGLPSILVNVPVYSGALIWQMQFLSDSKSIVYSGQQIQPNVMSIFLWQLR